MEREQLKTNGSKEPVIPILDDPPADKKAPEALPISVDNINGQLAELSDQNQILTARLVKMRGLMADQQRQLKDQAEVVIRQAREIEQLKGKGALRHGRQR